MVGTLKKLTSEQAEECVRLYESGLSLQPIAKYFGMSRQGMWDLLRRRTTMRPQKKMGNENHFYRGGATADERANDILEYAIKTGVMVRRDSCQSCGKQNELRNGRSTIEAHHPDYNKPLDVMWLCSKCHHEWHKHNKAIRKGETC